jgi:hypothetical protein
VRIETEDACRTALTAAGKTAGSGFVETNAGFPRGCYYSTNTNNAWLNNHTVGAGNSAFPLLCAAMTTGAPWHTADARVRARTHTHAHTDVVAVGSENGAHAVSRLLGRLGPAGTTRVL